LSTKVHKMNLLWCIIRYEFIQMFCKLGIQEISIIWQNTEKCRGNFVANRVLPTSNVGGGGGGPPDDPLPCCRFYIVSGRKLRRCCHVDMAVKRWRISITVCHNGLPWLNKDPNVWNRKRMICDNFFFSNLFRILPNKFHGLGFVGHSVFIGTCWLSVHQVKTSVSWYDVQLLNLAQGNNRGLHYELYSRFCTGQIKRRPNFLFGEENTDCALFIIVAGWFIRS
jgi:hypothetical protein